MTAFAKHELTTSQVSDGQNFCKAYRIQKHLLPLAEAMIKSTQFKAKTLSYTQNRKKGVLLALVQPHSAVTMCQETCKFEMKNKAKARVFIFLKYNRLHHLLSNGGDDLIEKLIQIILILLPSRWPQIS